MQSNKHHTIIKLPSIETLGEILQKNEQSLSKNLTKNDEQIAKLQGELSAERDSRKEERFIWIIVSMFFFDCFYDFFGDHILCINTNVNTTRTMIKITAIALAYPVLLYFTSVL